MEAEPPGRDTPVPVTVRRSRQRAAPVLALLLVLPVASAQEEELTVDSLELLSDLQVPAGPEDPAETALEPVAPADRARLLQEIEQELFRIEQAQRRLRELLANLGGAPASFAEGFAPGEILASDPILTNPEEAVTLSAEELYREGRTLFGQRNYFEAEKRFREFVASHPEHEYVTGARYWLAEILFEQGQFREAIEEFEWQLSDTTSPWRLRARLKTGYAWFELGDFAQARRHLQRARDAEPGSRISRLAQLRLDRMEQMQ